MAPPIIGFDASELRERIQVDARGKGRKPTAGQRGGFDLARCELLEMLQYKCTVEGPHNRDAMVQCWPVARWFRRCQDRNGTFMVETTAWEKMVKV